jgi:hypothetical protein
VRREQLVQNGPGGGTTRGSAGPDRGQDDPEQHHEQDDTSQSGGQGGQQGCDATQLTGKGRQLRRGM